ncbi:hypothetical protein [Nonomuraea sp. NPDC046570]|uniref:hypothetical protein n=1 Tax=Nonomuraea sp. NPDC046570 TaxID=3155255 RepID=UPI003408BC88
MRAYGWRGTLAVAAGLLAAVTACSGSASVPSHVAATAPASPSSSAPAPAVTKEEAAAAFAEYIATDDMLRAGGELSHFLSTQLVRDGQTELTSVAYLSTRSRPPRYTWGEPTLLVPRLKPGEPLWFSAIVRRDDRTAITTFVKAADWRLSALSLLEPGQELPEVQLDADGYAATVPTDDRNVLISPKFMAPLHATVAERGSSGIAAGLITPGPYTTEIAGQIADDRARWTLAGFSYDSILSAGEFPVYALRTTGNGALIQYSLTRTTTVTNAVTKDPLPVPDNVRWLIKKPTVPRSFKITELRQYATAVPASAIAGRAATVIAQEGAITRASGF